MSIKDDLHTLVDRLDDDDAAVALSYLREILETENRVSRCGSMDEQHDSLSDSEKELFADIPRRDPLALAKAQGVLPPSNFDDLLGNFWPDDESVDEFIAEIRDLRRQDGYA
ncbi:MAG TPA: hypothetical protein VFV93_04110 [Thermomicrobiales bacterium]|nr:hypothetical protein [Thermomicrobiales bacterium]